MARTAECAAPEGNQDRGEWMTVIEMQVVTAARTAGSAAPVASALVMRPGTQVRSIFHLGVGMRRASEMERVASTVSAVPRITVESSLTGMTTMPPSAAAR